ncbi:hypothetical protein FB451DRAFT_1282234 [Mycena latifolia]|nr:hypothetical protein FB451DRAFT_1282234 [Mycena latifolia]
MRSTSYFVCSVCLRETRSGGLRSLDHNTAHERPPHPRAHPNTPMLLCALIPSSSHATTLPSAHSARRRQLKDSSSSRMCSMSTCFPARTPPAHDPSRRATPPRSLRACAGRTPTARPRLFPYLPRSLHLRRGHLLLHLRRRAHPPHHPPLARAHGAPCARMLIFGAHTRGRPGAGARGSARCGGARDGVLGRGECARAEPSNG